MDAGHGSERSYLSNDEEVSVLEFDEALSLIHIYGGNYYHLMVEILPRFHIAAPILALSPSIPVLLRKGTSLTVLKLLGVDVEKLNVIFLDGEKELVYVRNNLYFPLLPRCLHAPKSLWSSLRKQIQKTFSKSKSNETPRVSSELTDSTQPIESSPNSLAFIANSTATSTTPQHSFPLNIHEFVQSVRNQFSFNLQSLHQLVDTSSTAADASTALELPLIKIVYASRLLAHSRRHLTHETLLLRSLIDSLGLEHEIRSAPGQTLALTLHSASLQHHAPLLNSTLLTSQLPQTFYAYSTPNDLPRASMSNSNNSNLPHIRLPISLTIIYGNETLEDTVTIMSSATLLIGPHGAGLANMMFMPHHASVIEMTPDAYWNPCFLYLANAIGTKIWLVVGKGWWCTESSFPLTIPPLL